MVFKKSFTLLVGTGTTPFFAVHWLITSHHKISTESQLITQGVNGNEPIESMQYLKCNNMALIKIHNGGYYAHAQTSNAYNFYLS